MRVGWAPVRPMVHVSAGALEAFGARPIAGRLIAPADLAAGAPPVAVVNEIFARRLMRHPLALSISPLFLQSVTGLRKLLRMRCLASVGQQRF